MANLFSKIFIIHSRLGPSAINKTEVLFTVILNIGLVLIVIASVWLKSLVHRSVLDPSCDGSKFTDPALDFRAHGIVSCFKIWGHNDTKDPILIIVSIREIFEQSCNQPGKHA